MRLEGIDRVTFFGSSAGGYASVRHALMLGDEPGLMNIRAFAINPQTGFSPALLQSIRQAMLAAAWREADLGTNPLLPHPQDLCSAADSVPQANLCVLEEAARANREWTQIDVYFDIA